MSDKVAGVIIAQNSRSIDKVYDYIIPKQLCEVLCIGTRVIVPFGKGGRTVMAYVVSVGDKKDSRSLKSIGEIVDERAVFDENGWQLVCFMKKKYLCTYYEAIRLIIPTGLGVKNVEVAELLVDDKDKLRELCGRSENKKRIVDVLLSLTKCEVKELLEKSENSTKTALNALVRDGAVVISKKDVTGIGDKTVRYVITTLSSEEASVAADNLRKSAPKQALMLDILSSGEKYAVSDILHLAKTTHNTLNALVDKGFAEIFDEEVMRDPLADKDIKPEMPYELTEEQTAVTSVLKDALLKKSGQTFLLHGVTGAGKTEVYMHLIDEAIKNGRTAVVLVPEISLTPLMTRRFVSRFYGKVAIIHSGLSMGERYDEFKRILSGEVSVVVGARSAIFAPLKNIGVIIVDEEHENTYKSENAPRYHAREIAEFISKSTGAITVLASATPSVESYYRAAKGEYKLLKLKKRYNNQKLPDVFIKDMRLELENGNRSMFSHRLAEEIVYNLENGEQSILFLNRRGFSTFVSCRSCGYVAKCPHCNISLTYHKYTNMLTCHYCGYTRGNYKTCPECESPYIKFFGAGTQRLEQELKERFEGIGVVRMDVDTTSTKSSHERLLSKFENENIDVLIGTQMISKGLDFKNVTLVGVMAADASLYIDDYRSAERTFNLITQVAGRAGRGEKSGRVIVQTYSPDNSSIVFAANHDYEGFYADEIQMRRAMNYPPFCEIVTVLAVGANEKMVIRKIKEVAKQIKAAIAEKNITGAVVLGPAASSVSKIKDKYRYRIIIKIKNADDINFVLNDILSQHQKDEASRWISISIDKNPNSFI